MTETSWELVTLCTGQSPSVTERQLSSDHSLWSLSWGWGPSPPRPYPGLPETFARILDKELGTCTLVISISPPTLGGGGVLLGLCIPRAWQEACQMVL